MTTLLVGMDGRLDSVEFLDLSDRAGLPYLLLYNCGRIGVLNQFETVRN